jgi:formylglycine-generating enzyme required for sulfatase activity
MVFIPLGTFRMGSPTNEVDRFREEGPQTAVTISRGFWMGKYEVTQAEYLALLGSNPSWFNGDQTSVPGGQNYGTDLSRPVERVSWMDATNYCGQLTQHDSGNKTHPVGQKLPNAWGLYDMHGNVSQWCQDWFDTYPGGIAIDPQGPATGVYRMIRDANWYILARACRSAFRFETDPGDRIAYFGFRVLLATGQP